MEAKFIVDRKPRGTEHPAWVVMSADARLSREWRWMPRGPPVRGLLA